MIILHNIVMNRKERKSEKKRCNYTYIIYSTFLIHVIEMYMVFEINLDYWHENSLIVLELQH